jgi:hypothetical protein
MTYKKAPPMRYIALIVLGLMTAAPASAQYAAVTPVGAIPLPFVEVVPAPAAVYGYGYNWRNDRYGYSCSKYGYGWNCPYYDLPDWNGPMEIRNPGG